MRFIHFILLVGLAFPTAAQKKAPDTAPAAPAAASTSRPNNWTTTNHQLSIKGKTLNYTATVGFLTLREESGAEQAHVFFTYYQKTGESNLAKRPITYVYNGGPGSASVWLHMGALGPKRIVMTDMGGQLAPPHTVVDNEYTWLDFTDLVFVDPVETGFSRPAAGVDKKKFLGYNEDITSVGDFIHQHITQTGRWASPRFLAGESYGTTRSAGLSGYLQDRFGLYLNGMTLISSILNFQTARFDKGNDLPYSLFFPTYAAIAWYHKQVPAYPNLNDLLRDAEAFAMGEYTLALMKGDLLTESERKALAEKMARMTGLSTDFLDRVHLRIEISRFTKELLRKDRKTVGRLDGRFTGFDYDYGGENYEFDPSYNAAIYGPYTSAAYQHLTQTLGFKTELPYEILTGRVRPWNYNNVQNQYLNVAETLRSAMTKNPYLKVHIANGYYDLATPYFATDYTVNHMMLDKSLRGNISQSFYESGHMMYIEKNALVKLTEQVAAFYTNTLR